MSFEGAHKDSHVIIRRARPRDPGHESYCVSQLSCPGQHVLVSSINLPRRSGSRNCKLVAAGPKIRSARGLDDLAHDRLEYRVAGRKSDASLDLDLKHSGISARIVSVDNNVVERPALARALQLDTVDHRTGQAARLGAC